MNHRYDKLIIAGGSGFLGQSFIRQFGDRFGDIVVLGRSQSRVAGQVRYVQWDGKTIGPWASEIDGADAILNVVGRTVDCRKTDFNKRIILESRVNSVQALAAACRAAKNPPNVWVQSATAHIYGDTADEILDESSPIGTGFAPIVGVAWEKSLNDANLNIRTVFFRISFVLGSDGGALRTLGRIAKCGLGGATGSGQQYMSWIHEHDLNRMFMQAIDNEKMSGIYVATAPQPERNKDFMRLLRKAAHRPWSPPVPEICVRIGSYFLRTDPELALYGRRCVPMRLLNEGFMFDYPELGKALEDLMQ